MLNRRRRLTTYLLVICACLLAVGVWPVGYLRMLVGYGGVTGWTDGTDGRTNESSIASSSGSPNLFNVREKRAREGAWYGKSCEQRHQ